LRHRVPSLFRGSVEGNEKRRASLRSGCLSGCALGGSRWAPAVDASRFLGDAEEEQVAVCGVDEGIGAEIMAARRANARSLRDVQAADSRLHRTVLDNSI
jgi:hypothetical protein